MTGEPRKITGKQAVEGSAFLTANNLLLKFVGLGALLVLTSVLEIKGYGLYILLLSIHGVLSSIYHLGGREVVTADLSSRIAEGKTEESNRLLIEYFGFLVLLGMIAAFTVFMTSALIGKEYGKEVEDSLMLITILLLFTGLRHFFAVTLNSYGAFRAVAYWRGCEGFLRFIFIILIVWWQKTGVKGALLSDVLSASIGMILFFPILLREVGNLKGQSVHRAWVLPKILRAHGKWAVLRNILVGVTGNLRVWIINLVISLEAVAAFALARRLLSATKTFMPLKTVLIPTFAQNIQDTVRVRKYFVKGIKYKLLFSGGVLLLGNLLASTMINVLFPKYYPISVPIFRILLIMVFLRGFREVLIPLLHAMQGQKYLFYTTLATIGSLCTFCPLFTYLFGINGAAVETALSSLIGVSMSFCFAVKLNPSLRFGFKELISFDKEDKEFWSSFNPFRRVKENAKIV